MKNYAFTGKFPATTTFCKVCFMTYALTTAGLFAHMTAHAASEPLEQYTLTNRTIDTSTHIKNGLGI